jgi:hypothetical protein
MFFAASPGYKPGLLVLTSSCGPAWCPLEPRPASIGFDFYPLPAAKFAVQIVGASGNTLAVRSGRAGRWNFDLVSHRYTASTENRR